LNVSDAPAASFAVDQVNLQTFDCVCAELPVPLRGPRVAPEGTVSFVQCSPLGTVKSTEKPVTLLDAVFLIAIVPQ
jgi:hypothetical protein